MTCPLSVIVPAYNAAPWLARCLDALLAQELRGLEIILVDDASTDATPDIGRRYAATCPGRIRFLAQPRNMGPGAARNAGLAVAQGEYLGFADADDLPDPQMFLRLYEAARAASAQVAVCGMRVVTGEKTRILLPEHIHCAQDLLRDSNLLSSPWNKIYQRAFIEAKGIRFPQSRMSEDMAFAFKALAGEPGLVCVNSALYAYVKHGSCVTLDMSKRRDALSSLADLKEYLIRNSLYETYASSYRKAFFLHLFYYPACLLLIDALMKGNNRWRTLKQVPGYFYELLKFLIRS
ncbi:glycosyltransferase [Desulfovibrio sp. ZJ369]|uniref:glycosyltransferase family 2 protein n=1 Tax=Desulfovibrio sp. ZJ369 TaxID=2709793 RepID=UPI0013ECC4F0|nr:glycosyltransferase [Desulfovibrio sp. ZJ369]